MINFKSGVCVFVAALFLAVAGPSAADDATRACNKNSDRACVISEAMEIVKSIKNKHDRNTSLFHMSMIQSRNGFIKEAEITASLIDITVFYSLALNSIVVAQAKAGLISDAYATARKFETLRVEDGGSLSSSSLGAIAGALAVAGQTDAARSLIRSLKDKDRKWGLLHLSFAQAEAGLLVEALLTAREIRDAGLRASALATVAARGDRHLFVEAMSTANRADSIGRSSALRIIAAEQAGAGFTTEALATVNSIEEVWRHIALMNVGEAQAQAGFITEALATVNSIEKVSNRNFVLVRIAVAQAKAGLFGEALVTARGINEDSTRAEALGAIAPAFPN